MAHHPTSLFAGLEYLATAVILLDKSRQVVYANPAAEVLFAVSAKQIRGTPLAQVFPASDTMHAAVENAIDKLIPFREHELPQAHLREYTQVIIKESDRLQSLMDRLLMPHRTPKYAPTNIHEVLERVRSLLLAEFPRDITVQRDYDTSLPEFIGDREKLIQAVLNIARNAAQAMQEAATPNACIVLRTRVARQVTLAKKRYRVAIRLQIIDNGPGIPAEIRDRIFYPLVSGREGGSGFGLTLAQAFVTQHHGMLECESEAGRTCFTVQLPVERTAVKHSFLNTTH